MTTYNSKSQFIQSLEKMLFEERNKKAECDLKIKTIIDVIDIYNQERKTCKQHQGEQS